MQKNVEIITPDSSIKDASKIMYDRKVGSLVIEDKGELKGLITERDIAKSLFVYNVSTDAKVKDAYTTPLVSVDPDASILEVAEIISKTQILRIPVIRDGKIFGIISASDLAVLFTMFENEELERKFSPFVNES